MAEPRETSHIFYWDLPSFGELGICWPAVDLATRRQAYNFPALPKPKEICVLLAHNTSQPSIIWMRHALHRDLPGLKIRGISWLPFFLSWFWMPAGKLGLLLWEPPPSPGLLHCHKILSSTRMGDVSLLGLAAPEPPSVITSPRYGVFCYCFCSFSTVSCLWFHSKDHSSFD